MIVAVAASLNSTLYLLLNHRPTEHSRPTWTTPLDDVVPFWPWTMWPYLALFSLGFIVPLLVHERRAFVSMFRAYGIAIGSNFTFWLLCPTFMPRPPLPETDVVTALLYRTFTTIDTVNNACPSGHVTIPVVAFWALGLQQPAWRGRLALLLAVLAPTVLTTQQHSTVDLAAGIGTALLGIAGASWLDHCERRRMPR